MTQVSDFIKTIQNEGKCINHKDTDSGFEVTNYWCSTFIRKEKLLVKGEYANPQSKTRKAMIVLFDSKTGDVKGLVNWCAS